MAKKSAAKQEEERQIEHLNYGYDTSGKGVVIKSTKGSTPGPTEKGVRIIDPRHGG